MKNRTMVTMVDCECGEWTGEACVWHGRIEDTVLVAFIPQHLRASCVAANIATPGGWTGTTYEAIARVEKSCAAMAVNDDGDAQWYRLVDA